jgi:hypothetical protein
MHFRTPWLYMGSDQYCTDVRSLGQTGDVGPDPVVLISRMRLSDLDERLPRFDQCYRTRPGSRQDAAERSISDVSAAKPDHVRWRAQPLYQSGEVFVFRQNDDDSWSAPGVRVYRFIGRPQHAEGCNVSSINAAVLPQPVSSDGRQLGINPPVQVQAFGVPPPLWATADSQAATTGWSSCRAAYKRHAVMSSGSRYGYAARISSLD